MATVLKPGSLKNYFTTLAYLRNYLEKVYPTKDILLRQLKYEFITGFEHYIRTTPLKSNDPCQNNGTMKHPERLRKMATWATKNEWIDRDPFICGWFMKNTSFVLLTVTRVFSSQVPLRVLNIKL
jgi:integrase/recombinase XerD